MSSGGVSRMYERRAANGGCASSIDKCLFFDSLIQYLVDLTCMATDSPPSLPSYPLHHPPRRLPIKPSASSPQTLSVDRRPYIKAPRRTYLLLRPRRSIAYIMRGSCSLRTRLRRWYENGEFVVEGGREVGVPVAGQGRDGAGFSGSAWQDRSRKAAESRLMRP